jgi:hypothetical protein
MKARAPSLYVVLAAIFALSLLLAPLTFAKSHEWETAMVVKADFGGTETEAVTAPLPGGGAVGESSTSSGKHRRGVYWLKTDTYTYVIPNYCKANVVGIQWWLYLTLGGQTKISVDSSRTLHVMDDEGKDRKVHIIQRIANEKPQATGR